MIFVKKANYQDIGRMYGVTGNAVKKAAKRFGFILPPKRKINSSETFNKGLMKVRYCGNCGKAFFKDKSCSQKFCSIKCSVEYVRNIHLNAWKDGVRDETVAFSCSRLVRNYMLEKSNYKCELCGWGEINRYTNKVPLQIHHLDGNSLNNTEGNLQVLCPNCHSLTENFGSRNKNAPNGKSKYYKRAKK